MHDRTRLVLAGVGTGVLFLAVQLGAVALAQPFLDAGLRTVEDPSDPTNSVLYLGGILVATAVMLTVIKLGLRWVLRGGVLLMSGFLSLFVFFIVIPPVVVVEGVHVLAWGAAIGLVVLLYVYPEWYVIDVAGVVIGAGGAGLFGISFGPLPAILLLVGLAVYDALSVYRTGHMLDLAEGVTDLKLPMVLVVPLRLGYSFRTAGSVADDRSGSEDPSNPDREAIYLGLGDLVIPSILVTSGVAFLDLPAVALGGLLFTLPALTAMGGAFVGLAGLLGLVTTGRAQAGLPLLNGGTIGGYLLGAAIAGVPLVEAVGLAPYV